MPVVLEAVPAAVPVTVTTTVHDEPWVRLPPERLMELALALAVPPQLLLRLGVDATAKPAGRVSVNARPVRSPAEVVFGLLMLKVRVVVPPSGMLEAKFAEMPGGATTVIWAVDVLPVPKLEEVTVTGELTAPADNP